MDRIVSDLPIVSRETGWFDDDDGFVVLIDKPKGWSSFKVIRKLRRVTGVKKTGHAGTLDPMATGLLICCVHRSATRQIDRFVGLTKTYEGTLRLGQTTPSLDAETPVSDEKPHEHLDSDTISHAMAEFVGEIQQIPPMYSAVKTNGRRLYKLARKGKEVERTPRNVTVRSFELIEKKDRDVKFIVECSKGTYIRSLAHDLGQRLGAGAHLVALRRTRIGPFHIDQAFSVDELPENQDRGGGC